MDDDATDAASQFLEKLLSLFIAKMILFVLSDSAYVSRLDLFSA